MVGVGVFVDDDGVGEVEGVAVIEIGVVELVEVMTKVGEGVKDGVQVGVRDGMNVEVIVFVAGWNGVTVDVAVAVNVGVGVEVGVSVTVPVMINGVRLMAGI